MKFNKDLFKIFFVFFVVIFLMVMFVVVGFSGIDSDWKFYCVCFY